MKFGDILHELKHGETKKYARKAWVDGKYIVLMTEKCIDECFPQPDIKKTLGVPEHRCFKIKPYLLIKTKYDYEFNVYNPTYEEFTAVDWEEV